MAELIWGDVAVLDLENIYDYISRDSHQYAKHHPIPEFLHLPYREVIVANYRNP